MPALKWRDSFSVGVPALDDDHRLLIGIINRVDESILEGSPIDWVLGELEVYARDHFGREERMLEAANYPGIAEHRRQHEEFVEWLHALGQTTSVAKDSYYNFGETLGGYLRDWLNDHILKADMDYKEILSQSGKS